MESKDFVPDCPMVRWTNDIASVMGRAWVRLALEWQVEQELGRLQWVKSGCVYHDMMMWHERKDK